MNHRHSGDGIRLKRILVSAVCEIDMQLPAWPEADLAHANAGGKKLGDVSRRHYQIRTHEERSADIRRDLGARTLQLTDRTASRLQMILRGGMHQMAPRRVEENGVVANRNGGSHVQHNVGYERVGLFGADGLSRSHVSECRDQFRRLQSCLWQVGSRVLDPLAQSLLALVGIPALHSRLLSSPKHRGNALGHLYFRALEAA